MGIHDVSNTDANALVWSECSSRITLNNFLKNGVVELFNSTNLQTQEIHNHQAVTKYAKDKISDYKNRKSWFFWVEGRFKLWPR